MMLLFSIILVYFLTSAVHIDAVNLRVPSRVRLTRRDFRGLISLRSLESRGVDANTSVAYKRGDGTAPQVPLRLSQTVLYTCQIKLGLPEQPFDVLVDTGSHKLWVPSTQCQSPACIGKRIYDSSRSTSFIEDGLMDYIGYSSGHIVGYYAEDRLSIGDIALVNVKFTEVADLSASFKGLGADGILGLGIGSDERDLVRRLKDEKLISDNSFSFYLDSENSASELIFGVDATRYRGDLTFAPVVSSKGWMIDLDGVSIGNSSQWCESGCGGLIDTGSNIVAGPLVEVNKLNEILGAVWSDEDEDFMFSDCSPTNKPTISIGIQGKRFDIEPKNYIFFAGHRDNTCSSAFKPMSQTFWLLGLPFLERMYTVFDYGERRVGFAPTGRASL